MVSNLLNRLIDRLLDVLKYLVSCMYHVCIIWIFHQVVIIYVLVRNFVSHREKISHFKLFHSCPQLRLGNVTTKNIFSPLGSQGRVKGSEQIFKN